MKHRGRYRVWMQKPGEKLEAFPILYKHYKTADHVCSNLMQAGMINAFEIWDTCGDKGEIKIIGIHLGSEIPSLI